MAFRRFGIFESSEKTIEINVLAEICNFLEHHFGWQITVVSPSQRQERTMGFDEILEGLPPGLMIALQFKKPHPYSSTKLQNFAKFSLQTEQLQTLLRNFNHDEAFFIFLPLPFTEEIIRHRRHLLEIGQTLDIYDVPNRNKTAQITRTVRVSRPFSRPTMSIADPRKFEPAEGLTLKEWCTSLKRYPESRNFKKSHSFLDEKKKPLKLRHVHFLHIVK